VMSVREGSSRAVQDRGPTRPASDAHHLRATPGYPQPARVLLAYSTVTVARSSGENRPPLGSARPADHSCRPLGARPDGPHDPYPCQQRRAHHRASRCLRTC